MATEDELAARIRARMKRRKGYDEKRMFGGVCFLLNEHMTCGVAKGQLMVRVGPDAYEEALRLPGARPMDFTGRPLKGLVYVDAEAIVEDEALAAWLERAARFVKTLPAKQRKAKKPKKAKGAAELPDFERAAARDRAARAMSDALTRARRK